MRAGKSHQEFNPFLRFLKREKAICMLFSLILMSSFFCGINVYADGENAETVREGRYESYFTY